MQPKNAQDRNTGRPIRDGSWNGQPVRFFAGQVIVKFKAAEPGVPDRDIRSLAEQISRELPGGRVKRDPRPTGRALLIFDPKLDVLEVARRLSARPEVEYAEPDVVDSVQQVVPSDVRYVDQWAHGVIGSEHAWALHTGAPAVLIGIIDSGICMTGNGVLDHPDLHTAGRFILGTDYIDGGAPRDLYGHGTHVAGIAAAEANNAQGVAGMNWISPVYICRTLDAYGDGSSADFADAVEEIVDHAVAANLRAVINYSSGGGDNQTKRDACRYARDRGALLCAAAGNDHGGPVLFPAAYSTTFDNVVAVGSTDDHDAVSGFSNVGPEITVVAPGEGILSTVPTYGVTEPLMLNYDYIDGTSMATPLVTGLAALMWSLHPGLSHSALRNCLTTTAVKLGPGNFDNAWGHGRISAVDAMRCGDEISSTRTVVTT